MFHQLMRLILDDDFEVATAAALSLIFFEALRQQGCSVVLFWNDSRLYRAPYYFRRVSFGTIPAEYFSCLCRLSSEPESSLRKQVLRGNADSGL